MPERIFIGVAWPYSNGPLHLGHIAGCYLPADIFARYHRLAGHEVLMVSGSDQHGTPIVVRAEEEGTAPEQVADRYHAEFLDCWKDLGISFDLFTTTGTANHTRIVHDVFNRLQERGYLSEATMPVVYCPGCRRFLPDRFVGGTCPHCLSPNARGDQCPACGRVLDPGDLVAPRCRRCGTPPEQRDRKHVFLRLSDFQDQVRAWVGRQTHWRPNVRGIANSWLARGLNDRAITRDLDWGIPVPLEGYEDKRIYVWFEAVIGYLSASVEWAIRRGDPAAWRHFWRDPARHYYFMGKDNVFFHTIVWPAMLLGHGELKLPDDVPANEYLTLEGWPFSTSQDWAVWLPDYLARYDPDPLRFYLSRNMSESADADFSWDAFVQTNDSQLVATWGNLAQRVLTFIHRHFAGRVPSPTTSRTADCALMARADDALARTGELISNCRFRAAIREPLALARETNRYLDVQAPWCTIKTDPQACATTLYTALNAIDALKLLFAPFLPFTTERLHRQLGYTDTLADQGWQLRRLPAGQKLGDQTPLFRKLAGIRTPMVKNFKRENVPDSDPR